MKTKLIITTDDPGAISNIRKRDDYKEFVHVILPNLTMHETLGYQSQDRKKIFVTEVSFEGGIKWEQKEL